jgi:DNA-binding response OmpR family regulator
VQKTKLRILFVDDHDDTRELVSVLLRLSDYEVVTANDVADALKLARGEAFDLYVLDNKFPDGTGRELCERLREFDHETPVIFFTGDTSEADKQQGLDCGAQGYVTKPDVAALPRAIARVLHAG